MLYCFCDPSCSLSHALELLQTMFTSRGQAKILPNFMLITGHTGHSIRRCKEVSRKYSSFFEIWPSWGLWIPVSNKNNYTRKIWHWFGWLDDLGRRLLVDLGHCDQRRHSREDWLVTPRRFQGDRGRLVSQGCAETFLVLWQNRKVTWQRWSCHRSVQSLSSSRDHSEVAVGLHWPLLFRRRSAGQGHVLKLD